MRLPTVFGMCQSVETGLEEKEKEKKQTKEEDPLGRGGGHLERCLKRRKKEEGPVWEDQRTTRARRVPRGVARDPRSGSKERGRQRWPALEAEQE